MRKWIPFFRNVCRNSAVGSCLLATGLPLCAAVAQEKDPKPEGKNPKGEYPENPHDIRGREEKLLDQIRAMPNGDVKLLAFTELAERWVRSDSAAAWSYSSRVKDPHLRASFLRGIMPHLVKEDPDQVIIKLEEGLWWPDQWMHIRDVTLKVAKDDLDRAIEVFEKSTPDRLRIDWVAQNLAIEIVRQQTPEAAIEFADRQEPEKLKPGAYRGVAQGLTETDETRAAEFVESIEDEMLRRSAIFGMVLGKGWNEDPAATVEWANGLAADELRQRALLEIAWQWSQSDQMKEVKTLLENPDVSLEDRAFIGDRLKASGVFLE